MDEIDEILETNKTQSKAFKVILKGLNNPENQQIVNTETKTMNDKKSLSLISMLRNITKKLFLLVGIMLLTFTSYAQSNQGLVSSKIRVKLDREVKHDVAITLNRATLSSIDDDIVLTGNSQLDALNKRFSVVKMKRVFPDAGKNEYKHVKHGLDLWYELDIDEQTDLKYAADTYLASSAVISAEPIGAKTLGDYKVVDASVPATTENLPMNDPYLSDQWHYNNDGSLIYSVEGSDINLFPAWEVETGSSDVIVSIVDGGIDVKHEDLAQNVWVNEVEKNGEPGVDDDNNGFIDDINGFNFTTFNGEITAHDHGTHVAGTVGAINNNGIGVCGVAGGSGNGDGVKLMSCQIFNSDDQSGNFAAAIVYGADNGATISQNSWSYIKDGIFEQALLDAIDYFIAEAGNYQGSKMKGGVVIFAAGNQGKDSDHYPAYYPSTIAVASIGPNFKKAGYSNFGAWVDVASTGGNLALGSRHGVLSTTPNGNYSYMQGTSMACPHVSGVAALIVSRFGSESFTNEELRSRILTGVRNIDEYNPDYVGKIGSGLIDTEKALENNNSAVPDAITDLSIEGASQNFILLSWTVPNDDDDVTPISYAIYWSEEELTEENVSDANSAVIINGDKVVGDEFLYEVTSLNSLTEYHLAVIAIDRWGNKSPLSNVVVGQTNEGPQIGSDKEILNISVDIAGGSNISDVFNVLNNKDGVLRWDATTREVSNKASLTSAVYPPLQNIISDNLSSVERIQLDSENEFIAAPTSTTWSKSIKRYFTTNYPSYIIGDTDSTIANSMATRFYVEEEEGFNLTRVSAMMRLDKSDGPAIIEIYKGNNIARENLVYSYTSTDTSDGLMAHKEDYLSEYVHNLKEQLFFEQGDTFWIVYHVPAGNLYPLGIYPEASPEFSGNCLMSINQGETWRTLEAISGDGGYVWAVSAASYVAPLDQYVTLTPNSGEIAGIGQNEVTVDVDASKLINGEYKSNILISSNDTETPFYRVPVVINVNGHKPELNSANIINYGNVFLGLDKTIDIEILNKGYGRFVSSSIVSSLPDVFKIKTTYLNLPAQASDKISIEYVPNNVGNHNGTITLTSEKGDVYVFNVFGVGTSPAKLEITPKVITFDNLDLNETGELSKTLTISNVGDYPLQYGFTNFADDLSHIEWLGTREFPRYGYAVGDYPYPDGFVFNDISETGVDLTHFYKNDGSKEFQEVDLGFDFPYFGEKIRKMYVTKHGMLTLDTKCKFNATMDFHDVYAPNGYISLFASLISIETQGSITFDKGVGKFIIQFTDVRSVSGRAGQSYTYQVILYDSGDIDLIYDKIEGMPSEYFKNIYIAIENREKNDGLHINGRGVYVPGFGPKHIIHIQSPGHDLVSDVTPAKGVILPGQSQQLKLIVDRTKLLQGKHKELVSVLSNDPFNSGQFVEVQIDVISGGISDLQLSETFIEHGDIYQNQLVNAEFEVSNNGNKPITINSINSENGQLVYLGDSNVELKPYQTLIVKYSVKSDVIKSIDDNLLINDSEGNVHKVRVTANVVEASEVTVSAEEFTETLEYDEVKTQPFTISNTGVAPLEYAITGTSLVYPRVSSVAKTNDVIDDYTYVYKTSYDKNPATHNWYNVTGENKIPFFEDSFPDFWYEVELPFSFNFYEKEYTSIWIGMQGAITFTEPEKKQHLLRWPERMGVDNNVNNMIAAFYHAAIYQDWEDVNQSGVFYNVYDDKIVIEWRELFSNIGTPPFDRQLILYNDGRFKIQYNTPMSHIDLRAVDGVIGIENEDASEFVQVSYYQKFAGKDVAIEFSPARKVVLQGGESKEYDIVFDASKRFHGESDEIVSIKTNDPLKSEIDITAHVTINGESKVELSDELSFGEVMLSPDANHYTKEFYIKNTGLSRLNVSRFELDHDVDAVLQARVIDREGNYQWLNLPSMYIPREYDIEPFKKVGPFRILLSPENPNYVNYGYTNKFKFRTDFGSRREEFNIEATYILPPKATLDKTEISHISYDNSVVNKSIKIGNVLGKSVLNYQISLDYNRETIAPSFIEMSNVYTDSELTKRSLSPFANTQSTKQGDYNRILSHDTNDVPNNAIGIGGDSPFTLATAFIAPSDGFNLSNVQTWYIPESLTNSEIKVEIRVGSDLESSTIQHSQIFNYVSPEQNMKGLLIDFKLSEPVSLMPYEKFFVVFTYPIGVSGPQGIVIADDKPETFYMYYIGKWYDIQALSGFSDVGLMVRAAEKEAENTNWLEISDIEGSVEIGTEKEVFITLYPERTKRDINKAVMSFNTNDPYNKTLEAMVSLRKNRGPEIIVDEYYSVHENDTLDISFDVADIEGNGIKSVSIPEYANVISSYVDGKVHFKYMPTYSDAGIHTFDVNTEDDLGATLTNTFKVEVLNVNVAPFVINTDHIVIDRDMPQYKSRFDSIFYDPDNGEMIYTAKIIGNTKVAKVFMAGDEFIVSPLKTGFSKVELTALDEEGDKTTTVKNIVVNALLSNEELLATMWGIYPNPVHNQLKITVNGLKDKTLTVTIIDQNGSIVKSFEADVENNTIKASVDELSSGVYMVELSGKEGKSVNKLIKK